MMTVLKLKNPGVFPALLSVETIKCPHSSFPYNPIIADVLYKTTFLESWGAGVKRIIDACRENHVIEPK